MLAAYPIQDIVFICAVVLVWALGLNSGLAR